MNFPKQIEPLDEVIFQKFADLIYQKCRISLGRNKLPLLSARVRKRMLHLGIHDFRHYYDHVIRMDHEHEMVHLIDAVSTNVTQFFREESHFRILEETVKMNLKAGQKRFRFWSCACSTGEEPYSMAMTLLECLETCQADMKILATDISSKVLEKAQSGSYVLEKLKSLPAGYLEKYFINMETKGEKGGDWHVDNPVKEMVVFKRLDITQRLYPMRGPFDVVFCRNVMIYFDPPTKESLIDGIYGLLKPGGFLFVGHAESLTGMAHRFEYIKPAVYMKR